MANGASEESGGEYEEVRALCTVPVLCRMERLYLLPTSSWVPCPSPSI